MFMNSSCASKTQMKKRVARDMKRRIAKLTRAHAIAKAQKAPRPDKARPAKAAPVADKAKS
jgi:hypothetical protein